MTALPHKSGQEPNEATDAAEQSELNQSKAKVSMLFAFLLLMTLLAFAVSLAVARPTLSRIIGGSLSIYIVAMFALACFFWLLTWLYTRQIDQLERKDESVRQVRP